MERLNIPFDDFELAALITLSRRNYRRPRDEVRYIVRRELERAGALAADSMPVILAPQEVAPPERPDADTR